MKLLVCICALLLSVSIIKAQKFTPVDKESKVGFTIKNFGINTKGSFSGLKGDIVFDEKNLSASSFNVSVDASTVNTDNNMRDSHLKKEEYFSVEKYPVIKFTSDKITKADNSYSVTGNVTIKGTTKQVVIPFAVSAKDNRLQLKGSFKIKRKDFNIGGGSAVMGDDVTVSLDVAAEKA